MEMSFSPDFGPDEDSDARDPQPIGALNDALGDAFTYQGHSYQPYPKGTLQKPIGDACAWPPRSFGEDTNAKIDGGGMKKRSLRKMQKSTEGMLYTVKFVKGKRAASPVTKATMKGKTMKAAKTMKKATPKFMKTTKEMKSNTRTKNMNMKAMKS